jgi:hypothetical protein
VYVLCFLFCLCCCFQVRPRTLYAEAMRRSRIRLTLHLFKIPISGHYSGIYTDKLDTTMCSYTRNNLTTSRFPINAEKVNVSRFIIRSSSVVCIWRRGEWWWMPSRQNWQKTRVSDIFLDKRKILYVWCQLSHRNHSDILQNLRKNVFFIWISICRSSTSSVQTCLSNFSTC